jgi:hypothetical protein
VVLVIIYKPSTEYQMGTINSIVLLLLVLSMVITNLNAKNSQFLKYNVISG